MDTIAALPVVNPEIERWLPLVGFEKYYEVSDLGRIKSIRVWHGITEYVFRPLDRIAISVDGISKVLLVGRCVLTAFVGTCPAGMICQHLNGDVRDNRRVNLRWSTRAEIIAGRSRQSHSRLTETAVREIRRLIARGILQYELWKMLGAGAPWEDVQQRLGKRFTDKKIRKLMHEKLSYASIGQLFGVGPAAIAGIKSGRCWKHVK
jgi:hypothetical protein